MASQDHNEVAGHPPPSIVIDRVADAIRKIFPKTDDEDDDDTSFENEMCHLLIRDSSSSSIDRLSLTRVSTNESNFSETTTEIRKLDRALERELQNERNPTSNEICDPKIATPDPYENWECGFGFTGPVDESQEIPNNKADFLKAVKGEITTIGFIQTGLISYLTAISSGVHHAFSKDFLKEQTDATHKTIGQLWQITNNLQDVVKEVVEVKDDFEAVNVELKDAFGHALPWIRRTRAILVSSHVFYKINYVLGSDKTKHSV